MARRKRLIADLILLIASMLWGVGFYFQKAGSETTPTLTFNISYILAGVLLFSLSGFRLPKGEALKYSVLTGTVMFLAGNLEQLGVGLASIGNASFITSIYIVLVPFLAGLILRRKIRPHHWIAALISLAGLYLITTGGEGLDRVTRGDVILFIGSIFWALQILCVDKGVTLCDPIPFTAGQFLTIAVLQTLTWVSFGRCDLTGLSQSWPYLLANGILVLSVAFTMQSFAQEFTSETEASIIMGLESVFGALSGVLLYHEHLGLAELAGMALILTAVLLAVLKE